MISAKSGTSSGLPIGKCISACRIIAKASATFAISIGVLVFLGWAFNVTELKSIGPEWATMKINSAVAFLFAGISLALLVTEKISARSRLFGRFFAAVCSLIGLATLLQYLFGWDLGIDQLIVQDPSTATVTTTLGRMAPATGLNFFFIGLALNFLTTKSKATERARDFLTLIVAMISLLALLGYIYSVPVFYGISMYTQIPFHTAVSFFILALGVLCSRPDHGFAAFLTFNTPGSLLLRWTMPAILLTLVLLGRFMLHGLRQGLYATEFGLSLNNIAFAFLMISLLIVISRILDRSDRARRAELEQRLDYEKIFNISTEMICVANIEGYFKKINSAFERTLGYSRNELLEKPFLELVHPDDKARTLVELKKHSTGSQSGYFENRYCCKDGSIKFLGWTTSTINDEGLIFATARDITKDKQAAAELRTAYDFVEAVLDNVPNMIFVKDAAELRFIRFNKAGEELLGYSRQELTGKNDYDFFPKEEADFFTSKDRMVLDGREILLIPEESIHTKHHGDRILRTRKIPIYDKEGQPQYLLGISEDITEVKRLNEERRRTEVMLKSAERINILIQHSLDAVVGMNSKGIITSWNSQAEKIFGWEKNDAIGQSLANLIIPPAIKETYKAGLARFLSTGHGRILNQRIELNALRRGDVEFPVELAIIPIQEDSDYLFYAFIRDISDRKNLEQQQKSLLAKEHHSRKVAEQTINMQDDFLSIAAHELRTPITPISMQLQLLERTLAKGAETDLPSSTKQTLLKLTGNSRKEIDRLSRLIDELLDISRISAGRLVLNLEKVNLSKIVESQVERYLAQSLKAGSVLTSRIEPDIIGLWDPVRVECVVENLLTNAIKYGQGKPIELMLERKNKSVILTVQDHGIGISKEDKQKIFKKFERAVSVKDYSGFGLGLYITCEIVQAHKGTITVESEPHQGSTFVVEFPME